jgi:outer membrane protein TolC
MVKQLKAGVFTVLMPAFLWAQDDGPLNLKKAYELAEKNYPVTRQSRLIEQTASLSIDNLSKGFLPQITLSGQATYQSDVTKVPVNLPGINIEPPSKDQYKVLADLNQLIYDGGAIKQQKVVQQLSANVEEQKVQVELYKLKDRINQFYLGILFIDEQLKQVGLITQDLQTGIKRVQAQVDNGVVLRSNLNVLKAELLRNDQRAIELKATRKGLIETLSLFLGQNLPENTQLQMPSPGPFMATTEVSRPELKLFQQQTSLNNQQNNLIRSKNLPKASLFVQGGYGRPGLNVLTNEFDLYYIGGVRFNWSLSGLYTKKKEKELVKVNKQIIDIQKETFLLNTNTQLKQQQSDIEKLQQLVATDDAIIDLRHQVTEAARAQLENAVITANDYLREVNAEDAARQSRITHEVQLLQAQINYQIISGKQ